MVIGMSLYVMVKKDFSQISWRYLLGVVLLVIAWMVLAAIPKEEALTGMAVFEQYMKQFSSIFNGELSPRGGMLGAMLYACLLYTSRCV